MEGCPDSAARSCRLGHSGILVMEGQRQDEFLRCSNPGLERSGKTLRSFALSSILLPVHYVQGWCAAYQRVRRVHLLLLRGGWGEWHFFWHTGGSLGSCVFGEVLALLVFPLMYTGLGLRRCAYRWTRPSGGGRLGHYLRDSRGVGRYAQKRAILMMMCGNLDSIYASLGGTAQSPWLLCMYGIKGKRCILEKLRAKYTETSFPPSQVYLFNRNSSFR